MSARKTCLSNFCFQYNGDARRSYSSCPNWWGFQVCICKASLVSTLSSIWYATYAPRPLNCIQLHSQAEMISRRFSLETTAGIIRETSRMHGLAQEHSTAKRKNRSGPTSLFRLYQRNPRPLDSLVTLSRTSWRRTTWTITWCVIFELEQRSLLRRWTWLPWISN